MLGSLLTLLVLVAVYMHESYYSEDDESSVFSWNPPPWRSATSRQAATISTRAATSRSSLMEARSSSRSVTKQMMTAVADAMPDHDEDDDDARHHSHPQSPPNPTFYGWTPDVYPNPLIDPVRCAISGLVDPRPVLDPYNANITSSRGRTIDSDNENRNHHASHDDLHKHQQPLYLCDPDWVLGGMVLEDLGVRLDNFSATYSLPSNLVPTNTMASPVTLTHLSQSRPRSQGSKRQQSSQLSTATTSVHVAVATVRKMNLASVLRGGSYFSYEDENDMVNDAAQIFARSIFDAWFRPGVSAQEDTRDDGDSHGKNKDATLPESASYVLIFLSIQDRVCFITTGMELSEVLPWWRLDHVVASMKPQLGRSEFGNAIITGMDILTSLLNAGLPTWRDRLHDFMARFGVVIGFAVFTFVFGAWGEYRDRRKRWQYAEQRSKLSGVDRDKARQLQKEYHTRVCPICLEFFDYGDMHPKEGDAYYDFPKHVEGKVLNSEPDSSSCLPSPMKEKAAPVMRRVDTFGIPLKGVDGKKIKLLRCGHLFCETCWFQWVHSGCGNPCNCPVCRQDVGRAPKKQRNRDDAASNDARAHAQPAELIGGQLPTHPTYGAVMQSRSAFGRFAAFSPTPMALLDTLRGNHAQDALAETTPLSGQSTNEDDETAAATEEGCCSHTLGSRLTL